jgi:hypothetical protein
MFVSSYSTYIQTNASERSAKSKELSNKESSAFSSKLLEKMPLELTSTSNLPIDYLYKAKSFNTKLELNRQEEALKNPENEFISKSKELTKEYMSSKTLINAKNAYEDSTKIFTVFRKPQHSLDQTPQTDTRFPENIQKLKEENMRRVMVNTYTQNENYYKITA